MGFTFNITGRTAEEAARALADLSWSQDLSNDHLGDEAREFAAIAIQRSGDPGPGQQYRVKAEGHRDRHTVNLAFSIITEPATGPAMSEYGKADEDIMIRRDPGLASS